MAKKIKLAETEQATVPAEPTPETPATKKSRKAAGEKKAQKSEVVSEKPAKKGPARKQAKKPVNSEIKKAVGRKLGRGKKAEEKPKQVEVVKAKKAPGRKPGKKAAAAAPVVTRKKPAARKPGLIGRKADLIKMGEGAFLYSLDQQQRIEEMARVIANYERVFEAVRQLFSREMEEIEELVAGLLE
jgi:hypothetical protein